jgi:drug/metabolite transporter (DMT)-like permease
MPLLLAAFASVTFGVADFVGGFASRRVAALTVVAGSQAVALVAIIAAAPLFSHGAPAVADLAWGFGAGMAGAVGLAVFYHALATTRIGVAAPVASVVSTLVPVVFGIMTGERPAPLAWVGILLALPAMLLLPASGSADPSGARGHRAAYLGAVAGFGFGMFGILISRTASESGMWPLAGARIGSLALMAVLIPLMRARFLPRRDAWPTVAAAGILDMSANVLFLIAVRRELLSLVAVIMAFYPASTMVLARIVLGERTVRRQLAGLALAAVAVTLIAVG